MKLAIQREMWGSGKMNRGLWRGILQERDHLEDVDIDGRVIFKWAPQKWIGKARTVLAWLRIGTSAGFCEHGNEH
jgi:hypothetical protein